MPNQSVSQWDKSTAASARPLMPAAVRGYRSPTNTGPGQAFTAEGMLAVPDKSASAHKGLFVWRDGLHWVLFSPLTLPNPVILVLRGR